MFSRKLAPTHGILMKLNYPSKYNAAVHMLFVFQSLCILFVNEHYTIVDKVLLSPFSLYYAPKAKAQYIIEISPQWYSSFQIGKQLNIKKNE